MKFMANFPAASEFGGIEAQVALRAEQ